MPGSPGQPTARAESRMPITLADHTGRFNATPPAHSEHDEYPPPPDLHPAAYSRKLRVSMTVTPSERNTRRKEPEAAKPPPHRQVPGLLGDPRRVGVPGDAEHEHATGCDLDREENVECPKPTPSPRSSYVKRRSHPAASTSSP